MANNDKTLKKSTSVKVKSSSQANLFENDRPILNEKDLQERYSFGKLKSNNALKDAVRYGVKYYKPSGNCMKNFILDRIPFFKWITSYNAKENLLKDVISGLTIGNHFKFYKT
jgi:hypothetical protein